MGCCRRPGCCRAGRRARSPAGRKLRKSEAEKARARSERRSERKEGADDERPAADVVYEGGAAVQPPMLLVSEEGEARDSERERHRQPPETMLELPARKTEVGATRKHHHLRPGAVRQQVDRRAPGEDRDRPHREPHHEAKAREEVAAPGTPVPDVVADDHLREQAGSEDEEAG